MKAQGTVLATLLALCAQAALAQPPASPPPAAPTSAAPPIQSPLPVVDGPAIDLTALLERLGDELDREFIVDPRVPAALRVANTTLDGADYESLLALLRVHALMAVETADDQILVVPESNTRFMPSPVVQEDNARISDHEIVTRIIEVAPGEDETSSAAQLVPILRPMLSSNAQLASSANGSHLIIVDRYDNVRRITAVVRELTN
jgi:general secretion pathway protein D